MTDSPLAAEIRRVLREELERILGSEPRLAKKPGVATSVLIRMAVADAWREGDGLSFQQIVDKVLPWVQSNATNRRKLVHSVKDYLMNRGDLVKIGDKYYPGEARMP